MRIVSSTNRELGTAMREGKFREDLYFRLNVFQAPNAALGSYRLKWFWIGDWRT